MLHKLIFLLFLFTYTYAIDCQKDCANPDFSNPNYKPQLCNEKCGTVHQRQQARETTIQITYLKTAIGKLSIMVTVSLVLLVVMTLCLLYFLIKNEILSNVIVKSWIKSLQKSDSNNSVELEKGEQNPPEANGDISRRTQHPTSLKISRTSSVLFNGRQRKPSESTTPDETEAVEVNGYDNLGLSRSTLSTSRPSSPSSPNDANTSVNTTVTVLDSKSTP